MHISSDLVIPDHELTFVTSRSSGPGGQNVNKVSTRVTVVFDVSASPSLSPEQKQRVVQRLARRIDRRGVLRVSSQRHRTQLGNREAAVERLARLLRDALAERPPRGTTTIPAASRHRRLEEKRRRSIVKQRRRIGRIDEE